MRALVCLLLLACGPKGVHMPGDPDGMTRFTLNPPLAGTPVTAKGYLGVEVQPVVEAKGPLTSLTSAPDGDTLVWTLVVADPKGDATSTVRVPAQLAFPAKVGDVVELKLHTYGGGPNVIPQLVLLDDKGGELIAINDRPPGWSAEKARRVKRQTGSTDDAETFTVKIGPNSDAEIDDTLREVDIAGAKFYAQGSSVVRHLHGDAPPDWVGSWTDFAVMRAVPLASEPTPTAAPDPVDASLVKPEKDPSKIKGIAWVPKQNDRFRADVVVTSIVTSQQTSGRVLWTIGLADDPYGKVHPKQQPTLRVELPPQIMLPLAKGDHVRVAVNATGGGPNRRFTVLVTADMGVPIIVMDALPPDWDTAKGKKLETDKDELYDAITYSVKLGPQGKLVDLGGNGWRAVTIEGVHYVGNGAFVERKLHKGKIAPADYVGGWTDFTLIRVP